MTPRSRHFAFVLCVLFVAVAATPASAQVPARFYWKTLAGAHAVPVIVNSISGNVNPFDPAQTVSAGASIDATVAMVGYARTLDLGGRAATVAVLAPMGRVGSLASIGGRTGPDEASGFGDPMVEIAVNVIGPKAIKNIPDMLRYEPGFSVDVLVDIGIPIGEYDADEALNLGQNKWYGRLGLPVVWQLGAWVPGRRTTLEFLPSVWVFGDNDEFGGSSTLSTDPMFQLDSHLTRDLSMHGWASLDSTWVTGGKGTVDGHEGESIDNFGVGVTLGYELNENMSLTLGYMATVTDSDPTDLRMDGFRVSFVYGWHPLVEGMKKLAGE